MTRLRTSGIGHFDYEPQALLDHARGQHDFSPELHLSDFKILSRISLSHSNPPSTTSQVQDERMLSRHDPGSNAPDNLLLLALASIHHKFFPFQAAS